MRKLLTSAFLFMGVFCLAQTETYYSDLDLTQEVSPEKAILKKVEFTKNDTLIIQVIITSDNELLEEFKYFQNNPTGVWKVYDKRQKKIWEFDFSEIVYSKEPILNMYDNTENEGEMENYTKAEFIGGEAEMFRFVAMNIKYPSIARDKGFSGSVYLRFVIDPTGKVVPHSIIRGPHPILDLQAWNLIKEMPRWKPATKNSERIESYYTLPIKFTLR